MYPLKLIYPLSPLRHLVHSTKTKRISTTKIKIQQLQQICSRSLYQDVNYTSPEQKQKQKKVTKSIHCKANKFSENSHF